MKEIGRKL